MSKEQQPPIDPDMQKVLDRQARKQTPEQKEAADKKLEIQRQLLERAYKDFAKTEAGQVILKDLDSKCFYKGKPFGHKNSHTNFNLGMMEVINYIHREIDK